MVLPTAAEQVPDVVYGDVTIWISFEPAVYLKVLVGRFKKVDQWEFVFQVVAHIVVVKSFNSIFSRHSDV